MPPKTRGAVRKPRKKDKKNIALGQAHIKSTFNNTIVSITDPNGAVISWASSGEVGFKGSRKSTPFAAQMAAEAAAKRAQEHGVIGVQSILRGDPVELVDDRGVRHRNAFGPARGPGRVDDVRRVVRPQRSQTVALLHRRRGARIRGRPGLRGAGGLRGAVRALGPAPAGDGLPEAH